MAIQIELHNTGDAAIEPEVRALIEHALSDKPADWRVSIVGSRENDSWDMRAWGRTGLSVHTHWREAQENASR
jgi:hypothetical protein